MTCTTFNIVFGEFIYFGLAITTVLATNFVTWHLCRIFHEYRTARALQRSQEAIARAAYIPLDQRPQRPQRPNPEATLVKLRHPEAKPPINPTTLPGWREIKKMRMPIAAE